MTNLTILAELAGPEVAADPIFIAFVAGSAFAFGAVIGSFLNVCIARLPIMSIVSQYKNGDDGLRKEIVESLSVDGPDGKKLVDEMIAENPNLMKPRSRCPQCKNLIAWYDNIPIASWILLRTHCRHCNKKISALYPAVELISGLALAYFILRFDLAVGGIYYLVFASMLVVTGVDLAIFEIPDEIVIPGIPLGLAASIILPATLTEAVIGAAVGGAIPYAIAKGYYLLMKREGMGFGDVKLLAMIGAFFGWKGVIVVLLVASMVGSVTGLSLIALQKREARALIPFGPFLALGTVVYMLWGPELIAWYTNIGIAI